MLFFQQYVLYGANTRTYGLIAVIKKGCSGMLLHLPYPSSPFNQYRLAMEEDRWIRWTDAAAHLHPFHRSPPNRQSPLLPAAAGWRPAVGAPARQVSSPDPRYPNPDTMRWGRRRRLPRDSMPRSSLIPRLGARGGASERSRGEGPRAVPPEDGGGGRGGRRGQQCHLQVDLDHHGRLARATASFTATAALISQSKGQCGRGMLACCNLQLERS